MTRIGVRFLIVFLAFVVGISSASLWVYFHNQQRAVAVKPAGLRRAYERRTHYDAARGSLWEFTSSDGREFKRWTITCGSPAGARRKMTELLTGATKIVLRDPVRDAQGREIGEEVVAAFPASDTENGVASLFHVNESEYLVQITSSSLSNILDFRTDLKP
jgi:hypothetical protein